MVRRIWERLIGLTKTVLKKVLRQASVNLMTLQTIVVEMEAVLNDWPLTHLSSAFEGDKQLMPSQLLYCRWITSLPHPEVEGSELSDPGYGETVTKKCNPCSITYTAFLAVLATRILNLTKRLPEGQWYHWWHHRQNRRRGTNPQWWKELSEMETRSSGRTH